jgi:hypothetical protein
MTGFGDGHRVFLSYSSEDKSEVDLFDRELRRRGVPLWRDRTNLLSGRPTKIEIERAAGEAAGFVFYLTKNAAASEWVRETERDYALRNARLNQGFGLVPVFRDDMKAVVAEMQRLAAGSDLAAYDLRGYNGYVVDRGGSLAAELARAADAVLESLMATHLAKARPGDRLHIGLATRNGPGLSDFSLDLLIDWTADYEPEGSMPDAGLVGPALGSLAKILSRWPGRAFEIILKCHLTMALAVGFTFRRTYGADLSVVDVVTKERWIGPPTPLPPAPGLLSILPEPGTIGSSGIVVAIGISQPLKRSIDAHVKSSGLVVGHKLFIEPASGASPNSLQGIAAETAHQMACAVRDAILDSQRQVGKGEIHLFFAGPVPFAILLGQQLSSVGPVQTYEWLNSESRYEPSLRLQ